VASVLGVDSARRETAAIPRERGKRSGGRRGCHRRRDAELAAHDIQSIRLTWAQLQDELRVTAQVAAPVALAEARMRER
jgi:hypothetical protein